jgi:hypothetical protein
LGVVVVRAIPLFADELVEELCVSGSCTHNLFIQFCPLSGCNLSLVFPEVLLG